MLFGQRLLERFFQIAAVGSALLTAAIFLFMLMLAFPLLVHGGFVNIITSGWNRAEGSYGIYPMIIGSLSISFLALAIGFPFCLGCSFFIGVYGPLRISKLMMGMVRFMTGIPTVVYAFVALFFLVPLMREYVTGGTGLNILTASIVLSMLIAPTMIIFFVDAFSRVPRSYLMAVDALGGSPTQKLISVILPSAWPGIVNGTMLGLGRAMGDTLISLMLAGNSISIPDSAGDSARTLTAHIALVIAADVRSLDFRSIFTCGIVLYCFTLLIVTVLRFVGSLYGKTGGAV